VVWAKRSHSFMRGRLAGGADGLLLHPEKLVRVYPEKLVRGGPPQYGRDGQRHATRSRPRMISLRGSPVFRDRGRFGEAG
jgi:hypothetical protein